MSWVEKVPRRYDFCGCPPCGLCYDYVEDLKDPAIEQAKIEGIAKMALDLLGRMPTAPERQRLEEEADRAHAIKRSILDRKPPPISDLVEEYDKNQQEQYFNQQLAAAGGRARDAKELKREKTVLLDQIEMPKGPPYLPTGLWGATGPLMNDFQRRTVWSYERNEYVTQQEVVMSDGSSRWINLDSLDKRF